MSRYHDATYERTPEGILFQFPDGTTELVTYDKPPLYTIKFERTPEGLVARAIPGSETPEHNFHIWRESRCELIANMSDSGRRLFTDDIGAKGTLITYRNPHNGKTSWEVEFEKDGRSTILDEAVLDRYIKRRK